MLRSQLLELQKQRSVFLGRARHRGKRKTSTPGAARVSSCSRCVSAWASGTALWGRVECRACLCGTGWGVRASHRPSRRAAGFLLAPGAAGALPAPGLPRVQPGTASGTSHVCRVGKCHRKKGKSCLLVFPVSDPLPFQPLGKAGFSPAQGYVRLLPGPGPASVRAS